MQIEVCLPDNTHIDGFLGLYDKDIAIVTSLDFHDVCTIDLDLQAPLPSDGKIIAAARGFESGRLMVTPGLLTGEDTNHRGGSSREISWGEPYYR